MTHPSYSWNGGRPALSASTLTQTMRLTDWLVLGPFPLDSPGGLAQMQEAGCTDAIEEDPTGCQASLRPTEGQAHSNPALPEGVRRWERLGGAESYDLFECFPGHDAALAYAATYIHADDHTPMLIEATGVDNWFLSTIHVFLDGVEVGHGETPVLLHLAPGEHCLLIKVASGKQGESVWKIDVCASLIQSLGGDLGVGLIGLPGFWRGTETEPRVEVAAALVNTGSSRLDVDKVTAALNAQAQGAPAAPMPLEPGEVRDLRLDAPLGSLRPGDLATVNLRCGTELVKAEVNATVPSLPCPGVIHVIEGFHCDPVWVSTQHQYNLISLGNVRQLVDGCLADPSYRVFLHEIDYLKPFVDEFPEYRSVFFDLVRRGQVSLGSSYNQPNENNCSGEALIRNLLYGRGFHGHFLGGAPEAYHAWDVFGHIPQLSQILSKSGMLGVVWSKMVKGFPAGFRHMALDGSTLPHNRTDYGWATRSMDHLRTSAEPMLAERHSVGQRRFLAVDAADFFPPCPWMIGRGRHMADSYPKIVMSGAEEFFRGLADDEVHLPLTSRNPSQYHIGTQHSRSELKIANRMCENQLIAAECWATFAALMGATYPDLALDKAWRQVLFGQHHDALTGTSCDISYLDLMSGYREALELAQTVKSRATQNLADAVEPVKDGRSVVVFNALNWTRGGLVVLSGLDDPESVDVCNAKGTPLPSAVENGALKVLSRDVPSVGYTTLALRPRSDSQPSETPCCSEPVIENECWRIVLDPNRGGGIAHLVDKNTGRDLVEETVGVGNDLIALRECGDRVEASWEFWTTGDKQLASEAPAEVVVHESPIGQTAVITGRLGDTCTYRRTLTVRPGQRTIEASVELEGYQGEDDLFAVTLRPALSEALPIYEDRFGSIVARRGKTKFDYRTSTNNISSDCAIYPVYNWVEAGWSARVDIGKTSNLNLGAMGLVIPHDGGVDHAVEPLLKALAQRGITATPYYDDDDLPRCRRLDEAYPRSRFRAGRDTDDTVQNRLDDLAMCAQWMALSVAGNNAYLEELLRRLPEEVHTRLQEQEQKQGWGLVVAEDDHVPEGWPAMPVLLLSASSEGHLVTALSMLRGQLARDARIQLVEGLDFRSQRRAVDDYGLALLTTGTGSATMEPDGTLTLFLTHTSQWSESFLGGEFVPEHRDMIFHYGIYPHSGSWRDGRVVRAGYDFANPLTGIAPTAHEGPSSQEALPLSQSFLSLDAPGAVVTAIKPAGNPVPRFENATSNPLRGIIVRAYDAHGDATRGQLILKGSVVEAAKTNLLEEMPDTVPVAIDGIQWSLEPFAVETMKLIPCGDDWPCVGCGELGPNADPVQPVWCRYWKHNAGAHPMGFLPVGIFIDGDLPLVEAGGKQRSVGRFRVSIVNNFTDCVIGGVARVTAPANWRLLPEEIPYELGPRDHTVQDVTVAFDRPPRTGLIKARLEHSGQIYQDVIEAGRKTEVRAGLPSGLRHNEMSVEKERPLSWDVFRDGDVIVVRVFNPWREPVDAELAVISPIETWGGAADSYGTMSITPRHVGLNIPGRQEATANFAVRTSAKEPPRFWVWVKLMYHGVFDYRLPRHLGDWSTR